MTAAPRPGVVHEPDAEALRLHDEPLRKRGAKHGLVDIAVDRRNRRERAQLLEHRRCGEVADVEDQVGGA